MEIQVEGQMQGLGESPEEVAARGRRDQSSRSAIAPQCRWGEW